jgi:xanthosine utilization system XapX-like protein
VTNKSLLIGAAVLMATFGILVTVLERIRHPPASPVVTFTGITGVYLGLCGTVEHIRWLYLPAVGLLLLAAMPQLRGLRQSRRDDDDRPADDTA